jgi:hypothetical protein
MGTKFGGHVFLHQHRDIPVPHGLAAVRVENNRTLGGLLSEYDTYGHWAWGRVNYPHDDCVLAGVGYVVSALRSYFGDGVDILHSFHTMAFLVTYVSKRVGPSSVFLIQLKRNVPSLTRILNRTQQLQTAAAVLVNFRAITVRL